MDTYGNENICLVKEDLSDEIVKAIEKELQDYTSIAYLKIDN